MELNIQELRTQIALLQKDIQVIDNVHGRIDRAMDKLNEVSKYITEVIAVHEQKLKDQGKKDDEIVHLLEERRKEVEEARTACLDAIKNLREDVYDENKLSGEATSTALTNALETLQKRLTVMEKRQVAFEKFRWVLAGGGIVAAFILANFWKVIVVGFLA